MTQRPWSKRAAELKATESPYHELTAWNEWLEAWNARQSDLGRLELEAYGRVHVGVMDNVPLFAAFCAACDETAELTKGANDDNRDNQSETSE